MPALLSVDMHWCIVWLTLGERMGPQETALLMGVTEPTIYLYNYCTPISMKWQCLFLSDWKAKHVIP